MTNISCFDEKIYESLPKALSFIEELEDWQDKDIALLSSLNACASVIPGVFFDKGGKKVAPHTYIYVYGPSGSGKGNSVYANALISRVSNSLLSEKIEEVDRWKATLPKERSILPPFVNLHTLQKMTSANLWKQLKHQGPEGNYIRQFESSDLLGSLGSENALSKDDLINIYDQVEVVKTLNSDNFIAKIANPKASLGLSSTGETFLSFAKKHLKNGLLNRFLIYKTARAKSFEPDVFREKIRGVGEKLEECSNTVGEVWGALKKMSQDIWVDVSKEMKWQINEICRIMYDRLIPKNNAYYGFAMRLPENILRLAVVFSTLKQHDVDGFAGGKIEVDCVEFVQAIHGNLLKNVEYAVDSVAGVELNYRGEIESEVDLSELPMQFTTRDFEESQDGHRMTSSRRLKKLVKHGILEKLNRGVYRKKISSL